jgi:hypothetical protein
MLNSVCMWRIPWKGPGAHIDREAEH